MRFLEKHIFSIYRFCNNIYIREEKSTLKIFMMKAAHKYYSTLLSVFYGAYIPYKATIGERIKFNHSFHGVFISENAIIGNDCTILQHVTIGSNQPKSGDAPKIGDNVFIGVGCNIVGKTIIENDCTIGAGTTIAQAFIPKSSVVVGQKYRIL
ncbi:Serine acetyltransferase [compost metagenome]